MIMDDRLQTALDFSKYRQTLAIQRRLLKEKLQAKLTYGTAGGIFHIDHSLIAFVQLCIDQGRVSGIPLIDTNENPILIDDLIKFRDAIFDRYFSASFEYMSEYDAIKKSRTVEKLVDL
jgi:hypothetical protein